MNQEISGPSRRLTGLIRNFVLPLSPTPRGLPSNPAELIVAELAPNAVTHGRVPGRDFRLLLYVVGDTLRIEVTDTRGDPLPCPQQVATDAESGRGLLLVEALADRWGVVPGPLPRKTVWAEVGTGPTGSRPLVPPR
ncbi:ATP-binding protein [Streptomyces sp. ARC32]